KTRMAVVLLCLRTYTPGQEVPTILGELYTVDRALAARDWRLYGPSVGYAPEHNQSVITACGQHCTFAACRAECDGRYVPRMLPKNGGNFYRGAGNSPQNAERLIGVRQAPGKNCKYDRLVDVLSFK